MILPVSIAIFSLIFAVEAGISGELQLEVTCFHHPSRRDRWGNQCDMLSDCDPRFQFCLTDENPSQKKCNIGTYTQSFEDAVMLGTCAEDKERENFPSRIKFSVSSSKSRLFLIVTITERNRFSASKMIDELVFPVLPGTETQQNGTSNDGKSTPLRISKRVFTSGDKPKVEISAGFKCSENRYGSLCDIECKPSDSYGCQSNGTRKCKAGWRGIKCDQLDSCAIKPCKEWATCEQGKNTFRCVCNGRSGPQCQFGFDPCYDHQCLNGGSCRNHNDRPKCRCPGSWLGERCEVRNPCVNPNPCQPHGHCKINGLNFTCTCDPGWRGERCAEVVPTTTTHATTTSEATETTASTTTTRKSTTITTSSFLSSSRQRSMVTAPTDRVVLMEEKDHTAIIVIAVLSVLLIAVFASGLAFFLTRRMRRKRKKQRQIVRGNLTLLSEDRKTSSYESAYDDPDDIVMAFDSEIYTEPGVVYSFVARDQDGTVEVIVPPEPPAISERPPQPPRTSLESATSMNSNRVRYVRSTAQ